MDKILVTDGFQMAYKVGVVIPVLNQFELALDALVSISTRHTFRPYIIPNWRIANSVSASWNLGIENALNDGCEYVLVINDDIVLSPWTIDKQIEALEDEDNEKLILTTGWSTGIPSGNAWDMTSYPEPPKHNAWISGADFACFLITKFCFSTIGKFDENFRPAYFEDNDYHRRILLAGYEARIITQAPFFHYGSKTQQKGGVVSAEAFDLCKAYYVRKWHGMPGAETFATPFGNPDLSISDWTPPQ